MKLNCFYTWCLDTLVQKSSTNENTCSAAEEDNILVDNLDIKFTKKYLDTFYDIFLDSINNNNFLSGLN